MPEYQADTALRAAIESAARPAADRARDEFRHPEEALTFWGLSPAMTVVEVQPGSGGWWTAILRPYAQATGGRYVAADDLAALQAVEPGSADMVLIARAFHNWARQDRTDAVLAAAYRALKPGGVYMVIDHSAEAGSGLRDTETLHRIDAAIVKSEVTAAGFIFEGESKVLRDPADPRKANVYDASIRGKTDQFVLRFRKPK